MAKKKEMCATGCCGKCNCMRVLGWVMLVIGVLYLLSDLGLFTWFGATFSWFTVVFILAGLKLLCWSMKK
jgi:hypothetical protein